MLFAGLVLVLAAGAVLVPSGVGAAPGGRTADAAVQRLLDRLVGTPGGPIDAIVTLYRDGRTTVLRAGRADAAGSGAPRLGDHMRIASISKALTGAVALHLVQNGRLGLDHTIGQRLPGVMPQAWSMVTVREMLNHTSGLPDYTQSDGFRMQAMTNPRGYGIPPILRSPDTCGASVAGRMDWNAEIEAAVPGAVPA